MSAENRSDPATRPLFGMALFGMALAVSLALASTVPSTGQELMAVVEGLAGQDNPTRVQTLERILDELGLETSAQDFEHEANGETLRGRNVVIAQPGTVGELPRIVVGAHLDAAPLRGGGLSRGAIDNAAGTSVVVHLAQRLRDAKELRHGVDFVLFDLEERGMVGSRHYVEQLDEGAVTAMVNVDIGTSGEAILYGPRAAPGNEILYQVTDRLCMERDATCLDFPNYPPSDERSFQAAGIPNISFAVLPEIEAHQLWLRFNAGQDSGLAEGFLPKTARLIHTDGDSENEVEEGALMILLDHLEAVLLEIDRRLDATD